jgi:hypothetical protein
MLHGFLSGISDLYYDVRRFAIGRFFKQRSFCVSSMYPIFYENNFRSLVGLKLNPHTDKQTKIWWGAVVSLYFLMALPANSGSRSFIQSVIIFSQTVGLLGRVISPSQGRYLNTGEHKQRINAYTYQTSMSWAGFEPTILASERAKTIHALDCARLVSRSKSSELGQASVTSLKWNQNCIY